MTCGCCSEKDVALGHACVLSMQSVCEQPWGHTPCGRSAAPDPSNMSVRVAGAPGLLSGVLMSFINYVGEEKVRS